MRYMCDAVAHTQMLWAALEKNKITQFKLINNA